MEHPSPPLGHSVHTTTTHSTLYILILCIHLLWAPETYYIFTHMYSTLLTCNIGVCTPTRHESRNLHCRHIYHPLKLRGWHRGMATMMVFFLSAFFHEVRSELSLMVTVVIGCCVCSTWSVFLYSCCVPGPSPPCSSR